LKGSKKPRPQEDVPSQRRHARTRPSTSYQPKTGALLQYGNYSLLRILTLLNNAGEDGITTLMLLDKLGSRANRINDIIAAAERLKLIERIEGEPPAPGQFTPIFNVITDKGRRLLQEQLLSKSAAT